MDGSRLLTGEQENTPNQTHHIHRSQQDIESQKAIKDAQNAEAEFFKNHPVYRGVTDRCGSAVLARRCNKVCSFTIQSNSFTAPFRAHQEVSP